LKCRQVFILIQFFETGEQGVGYFCHSRKDTIAYFQQPSTSIHFIYAKKTKFSELYHVSTIHHTLYTYLVDDE